MGADDPDAPRPFPYLALGIRPHKPGVAPGPSCVAVLADIGRRHLLVDPQTGRPLFTGHPDGQAPDKHPTGWLGADRANNGSVPEGWVLPAKALGYEPVFDYKENDLGHQATHEGAVLVDGTWYSPSIMRPPTRSTRPATTSPAASTPTPTPAASRPARTTPCEPSSARPTSTATRPASSSTPARHPAGPASRSAPPSSATSSPTASCPPAPSAGDPRCRSRSSSPARHAERLHPADHHDRPRDPPQAPAAPRPPEPPRWQAV